MPAFLTHMVAADNVYSRLGQNQIKDVIADHTDAYHSGAQGGDYFMLYKYYSMWAGYNYKLFGFALHRARPKRFFLESAEYVKNKNSDLLKSFFYGYITHYCLDYLVHPLINKLGPNPMSSHNVVEYGLDTVYARENSIDAITFDRAAFVEKTHVKSFEIDDFFYDTHRRLYCGFKIDKRIYQTAYEYFAHYNRIMYMPDKKQMFKIKLHNLITILNLPTMLYYPYEEVKDLFDYSELIALTEKGIGKSLVYISALNDYYNGKISLSALDSMFFNVNFNGRPVTPREERMAFKKAFRKAASKSSALLK